MNHKVKKRIIFIMVFCFLVAGSALPAYAVANTTDRTAAAEPQGFIASQLTSVAGDVLNNITQQALEDINAVTDDPFTNGLMLLLGGSTGRTLAEIQEELEKTQDMIRELQQNVNALAHETQKSLDEIQSHLDRQDLEKQLGQLDGYCQSLEELSNLYSSIISSLYVNGELKEQLTNADLDRIDAFMARVEKVDPASILTGIASVTSPKQGRPLYDVQMTYLKGSTSFRHKTYLSMSSMANYVSQLRSCALNFVKEQTVYKQMKSALKEDPNMDMSKFVPNMDTYMNVYYNPAIEKTNAELKNNQVFADMAEVFKNAKDIPALPDQSQYATDAEWKAAVERYVTDYYSALENALDQSIRTEMEVFQANGERAKEKAYKVVSNKDDNTYYISLAKHTLSEYLTYNYRLGEKHAAGAYFFDYLLDYGAGSTADGRYILPAGQEEIKGLFNNNVYTQLSWLSKELADSKGKSDLPNDMKMIFTTNTKKVTVGESENKKSPDGNPPMIYNDYTYEQMQLIDANNFSTAVSDGQYIQFQKSGKDPHNYGTTAAYQGESYQFAGDTAASVVKDTPLLCIYTDIGCKDTRPNTNIDLPPKFSLSDGQTLDLSRLSGDLQRTITVSGKVTIDGGGNSFQGLQLYLCNDAQLTLKNISMKSDKNVITAVGPEVTVIADGNVSIAGTSTAVPVRGSSGCKSMTLAGASPDAKMNISADQLETGKGVITAENSLTVTSLDLTLKTPTDIALKAGNNSKILSTKLTCNTAADGYGELTMASGSIENSTLNLTYGGIVGDVEKKNNQWTGKIRYKVSIKTGTLDSSDTVSGVGMTMHFPAGDIYYKDIQKIEGVKFAEGSLDTFYCTLDNKYADPKAITLQLKGDDGWYTEYVEVVDYTASSSQEPPKFYFYKWMDNKTGSNNISSIKSNIDDKVAKFEVATANADMAGTASNIKATVKYEDSKGTVKTMPEVNLTEGTQHKKFSQGTNETVYTTFGSSDADVKKIIGVAVSSDHTGDNAGWKLQGMKITVNGITHEAKSLNQWFLKKDQKSYFGDTWSKTGACIVTTATANTKDAGTDAKMSMSIVSDKGTTKAIDFSDYSEKRDGYDPMEQGKTDEFHIAYDDEIGNTIKKIIVTSNGSGTGPTWECNTIKVALRGNDGTSKTFNFTVNKKIAKGTFEFVPDGNINVAVTSAKQYDSSALLKQLKTGNNSVQATASKQATLGKKVLAYLVKTNKTLVLNHKDGTQWIFNGSQMKKAPSSHLNLGAKVVTKDLGKTYGIGVKKPAAVLQFTNKGTIPAGTTLKVNLKKYGFKPGQTVYPYSANAKTKKVALKNRLLKVNSSGDVKIAPTKGSDYLFSGTKVKANK